MPEITPELAIQQTMQALPDAQKDSGMAGQYWGEYSRTSYLAPRGTRRRERDLRELSRHDDNSTVISALVAVTKIWSSTQWEIIGPEAISKGSFKFYQQKAKAINAPNADTTTRPDIAYWQQVFRDAEFGRGWTTLVEKLGFDYLRQDAGAFLEVIAPGNPLKPPTGPITGLSVLDSVRCWPTGDPEFPVIYWNRKSEYHLIHRSRVIQFQDMPDSDELRPGYGACALSRAVAISQREILMNQYLAAQLDDKPPPGILTASGLLQAQRDKALQLYRTDQSAADQKPDWGRLMWIFSIEATSPVKLDMLQFSKPPEKFDWKIYTDLDIDLLALAIGVDRQDLMQLSGGSGLSGSKGQSETMAQKARGKTIGLFRTEMERKLNDLLPEEYEFKWKYKDTQEELERAQIATAWSGVTSSLSSALSPDEIRKLLASQVEPIREAISDENGKILSVGDGDVQTAQQIADDAAAAHALTLATTPPPVDPNKPVGGGAGKPVPKRPRMGAKLGRDEYGSDQKAIQATRIDFEDDFAEAVKAVQDGSINRRRFGIVARALIKKYGRMAYTDGLEDGGISDPELSDDDYSTINGLTVEQSVYVTAFADTLFSGVEYTPEIRAEMWWNKSILPFYQFGTVSADKNGLYEWVIGNTEKHCKDCLKMNGQVHRYRDYIKHDVLPQGQKLTCHGYFCDCKLTKTTGKSSGRWI